MAKSATDYMMGMIIGMYATLQEQSPENTVKNFGIILHRIFGRGKPKNIAAIEHIGNAFLDMASWTYSHSRFGDAASIKDFQVCLDFVITCNQFSYCPSILQKARAMAEAKHIKLLR